MEEDSHGNVESTPKKKKEYSKLMRENPWMVSTFVVGFLVVLLLAGNVFNITGNAVSGSKAGSVLADFAYSQGVDAEVVDVTSEGSFYKVILSIEGTEVPYYVTKDGKYFVSESYLVPLAEENSETTTETTEVPTSDMPEVGLYIWSYCPYGVTALSPFAEVASLLGNYADFKVHLYYAGHGDFEVQQNKIQACIQDLGYENEYWEYAETFANEIYSKCSGDIDCDKDESVKLMKSLGIDSNKVLSCVGSKGETLQENDYNSAKEVGVTGSPSLVINGVKVTASRNAEAYKSAVCDAFNDTPKECSTTLSSGTTTSSGNC